ncbi:hypothetical protein MBLNU459_g2487t1 [Dothideomycetes sp. NU459]
MAYNYPPPGAPYNRPPGYGAFPGAPPAMGAPPTMGGAPGVAAPAMSPPPGMNSAQSAIPPRPGSIPASFQPPQNLPNINFNAPVIRLGVSGGPKPGGPYGAFDDRAHNNADSMGGGGGGSRNRSGLGADSRDFNRQPRESAQFVPPTMEEVRRTIFVGGLEPGVPDDAQLEEIMAAGGQGSLRLRRWTRVNDADGNPCRFGFAEYEDAGSLHIARDIFAAGPGIEVPLRLKGQVLKDDEGNVKKAKLMVVVDDKSAEYIEQWSKGPPEEHQFKLDKAREDLDRLLVHIASQESSAANGADHSGDAAIEDGLPNSDNAEVITIPVAAEDELSDIPADMRETVAAEIKAFRDRSMQRDVERLRKEEELEAAEKLRSGGSRASRLASPPPSAPSGPGGANGVPVGPRDRGVQGAPAGPKGYRGAQMPKDYADGVNFVNGDNEDDDDSASDSEIERRKKAKKDAELEKVYLDQERRWLNVERRHIQALARADADEEAEDNAKTERREAIARQLKEFDDEEEMRRPSDLFYRDRKAWVRARRDFKHAERARDDKDRADEARERARDQHAARGMADDFLAETGEEIQARSASRPEQRSFTLNLGGLGGRARDEDEEPAGQRTGAHTLADMEGFLDDEDEAVTTTERRTLRTVDFKPLAAGEKMTDDERREATRQLAASIPNDTAELFAWPVKWEHLPANVIEDQLRPYVQKKIMESLGVQEDMLVELIENVVRRHGKATDIVEELSDTLDEEAEGLARKVWRMVVFYSESEARGLGM